MGTVREGNEKVELGAEIDEVARAATCLVPGEAPLRTHGDGGEQRDAGGDVAPVEPGLESGEDEVVPGVAVGPPA